ncbi:MAG: hypothetical protein K2X71_27555 [Methylobacterium sp.]|uniref:hypothetical protein n=1 Tax=Methylobacterium sp. TaxID=409 RepID=UPI00258E04B8|nr:hypothetical protein [Methylobacterium sp.]MBY0299749.1 hypothetical protein [Methylobacterium sp.]
MRMSKPQTVEFQGQQSETGRTLDEERYKSVEGFECDFDLASKTDHIAEPNRCLKGKELVLLARVMRIEC